MNFLQFHIGFSWIIDEDNEKTNDNDINNNDLEMAFKLPKSIQTYDSIGGNYPIADPEWL